MEQTNVKRLLHTLVPFLIMTLLQRLLSLGLGALKWLSDPALTELLAFLPTAAVGLILFRLHAFETKEEANADSVPLEVPPLARDTLPVCLLAAAASSALMVLLMLLLSTAFAKDFGGELPLSPVSAVSLIVVHPLAEEYLFRWQFYRSLRKMSPFFGCLAQAVMFAILHSTVDGMVYALTCGVVLASVVEETGDWRPALAAHSFINLRSYLCLRFLADYPMVRQGIDLGIGILGMAALAGFWIIRGRRLKTAESTPESDSSHENEGERP